jgi:hypothetical protein
MLTTPEEDRQQAIDKLKTLKFSHRTNPTKRTINNHDAVAFLLWRLGPMQLQDIQDAMMEWRFGKAEWREEKGHRYVYNANGQSRTVPCVITKPKMYFTYLFNTCASGGYGFVGANAMSPGNWMHMGYSVSTCHKAPTKAEIRREKEAAKDDTNHPWGFARGGYFFRRTYWYRAAKGIYAPTVECAKRMVELSALFA